MLMTMRALTEGCRAMASVAAAAYDAAHPHPDAADAQQNQAFYEFLVPLVKGYSTEMSLEVTSLGVQVHGGMGYIEETGAAQYLLRRRILTIYEGTTAIQANDLVGRKTAARRRPDGAAIAAQIETTEGELAESGSDGRRADGGGSRPRARPSSTWSASWSRRQGFAQRRVRRMRALPDARRQPGRRLADGARPARRRGPVAKGQDVEFMRAKIATARFYADHILTKAPGLRDSIVEGAESVNRRCRWKRFDPSLLIT